MNSGLCLVFEIKFREYLAELHLFVARTKIFSIKQAEKTIALQPTRLATLLHFLNAKRIIRSVRKEMSFPEETNFFLIDIVQFTFHTPNKQMIFIRISHKT